MAKQFTKNNTPATGAVAMYLLKEALKSAGWVVLSSSDGTTYNAGGDQITTGASGAGGMANNRAWFRITDPAGIVEYTWQRDTAVNTGWRWKISALDGFVGGSPGATQTPSATDEFVKTGGGTDASPTFSTIYGTDGAYRLQIMCDSSTPYGWWSIGYTSGTGVLSHGMFQDPVLGASPDDTFRYTYFAGTQPFAITTSSFANEAGGLTGPVARLGMTYVGVAALLYAANTSGLVVVVPSGGASNPHDGDDDEFPMFYYRRAAAGAPQGGKGVSSLFRWGAVTRATGELGSIGATGDRIAFNGVSNGTTFADWDNTTPTI